jgi:hypothetical protein
VGNAKEGWQKRVYNVELTNGSFPMDGWLMASGYITLDAIRAGYFLDTLSARQSVAMCLLDLAKGYERKTGQRGPFVNRCVARVLAEHPANINALLLQTELLKDQYMKTKSPADYHAIEKHCSTLVANGYREMPMEMYLNWLFEVRAKGTAFLEVPRKPKRFDTQKGNPHRHDTTLKIHVQTLTNGRYDEFPELAETTYVGSAVYDVYNRRIIGFVRRDTLYGEANLEPEVVSRWLSTDPIHHPYQSPYTGFDNNPVYYVDPNGTTVGDYYSKDGYYVGSDGKNDNKVYAVNGSGNEPYANESSSATTLVSRVENGVQKEYNVKNEKIQDLVITHTQFLDRAHWAFGEGPYFAEPTAFAINNIAKEFGEDQAFSKMTKGLPSQAFRKQGKNEFLSEYRKLKGSHLKEIAFSGDFSDDMYNTFSNYRSNLSSLNVNEQYPNYAKFARVSISATIKALSGVPDITNNANEWVGTGYQQYAKDNDRRGAGEVRNFKSSIWDQTYFRR